MTIGRERKLKIVEDGLRHGASRPLALLLAFVLALGACTAPSVRVASGDGLQRELLNSERIARRFGSYGVEILESDARLRISSLFSVEQGRRVCRTLAVVVFPAVLDPAVAAEHRQILDGGSIGAVFAEGGWAITKRQRLLGEVAGPGPADRLRDLMGVSDSGRLAVDVYSFVVTRHGRSVDYATIAEVYHPEYLRFADLRALYGRGIPSSAAGDPELLAILDLVATAVRGPSPGSTSWNQTQLSRVVRVRLAVRFRAVAATAPAGECERACKSESLD